MPNINPQPKRPLLRRLPLDITQNAHGHHIVQPVVVRIARLEHHAQLQAALRLRGPRRLHEDVGAVVGAEVVARVGAEDARLRVGQAPVGAEVEDFACGRSGFLWLACWVRNDPFTGSGGSIGRGQCLG